MPSQNKKWVNMDKTNKENKSITSLNFYKDKSTSKKGFVTENYYDMNNHNYISKFSNIDV